MSAQAISISISDVEAVSGLWTAPDEPCACMVLAHGAGVGMSHPSMTAIADGLLSFGVATLRFQFPYMELGRKRVDPPAVAQWTVRAAVAAAQGLAPHLPLFAGGRSFGGRMSSQAQAQSPLDGVRGLVFFGFPLHPAGKPSVGRADHLSHISVPMLFLQGTRDALADLALLQGVVGALGDRATLRLIPEADHSFHVPTKTGRRDAHVLEEVLTEAAGWMGTVRPLASSVSVPPLAVFVGDIANATDAL